jgi:hypothetical protein
MKAARLTAASVHHLADPCEPRDPSRPAGLARSAGLVLVSVLADTTIFLSRCLGLRPMFVPSVHVLRTYTLYRYVVQHDLYDV